MENFFAKYFVNNSTDLGNTRLYLFFFFHKYAKAPSAAFLRELFTVVQDRVAPDTIYYPEWNHDQEEC